MTHLNRIQYLPLAAALIMVLLGGRATAESAETATRPNIIFLLADDQSVLSTGCYGNDEVQTPEMDRLGRDGIIFDRHYNTTAICMASRASIMTGMYEYKAGCNFDMGDLSPELWQQSYPVLLRENGYLTAFAGKFGFEVEGRGLCEDDFDKWGGGPKQTKYETAQNESMQAYAEEYPHSTLSYGAFGQDFIKEAAGGDQPFCLSISFKAPHRPVRPDPKFDHIYAGKTFTKPGNYGREHGEHLSEQSKQGRQYPRFIWWGYRDNYDEAMALYYQQVYAIDVALGMIREELERQGLAENTVIIYTSDNGFICGSHGYGSKVLPMEESATAPLMIYDPRRETSGMELRSPALTGNIDFAPTILELAGLPVPENMDGKSLLPLLDAPDDSLREQMAFMNVWGPEPTTSLTVLTGDWKYTYWWYEGEGMTPAEELFHLAEDPLELENLAGRLEYQAELDQMRARYDEELSLWQLGADPEGSYAPFATHFRRKIE